MSLFPGSTRTLAVVHIEQLSVVLDDVIKAQSISCTFWTMVYLMMPAFSFV